MQARVFLIADSTGESRAAIAAAVHEAFDEGYHVGILTAGSAEQVNQLAEGNVVDLFILHANNLTFGGNETVKDRLEKVLVLAASLKIGFQKPVVVLSADPDFKSKALEGGADAFLPSPVDSALLQHTLRSLLAAGDC